MYAKNAMGGNVDPYINVIFSPVQSDEPHIVSLIIFGWSDVLDVGVPEPDGSVVSAPYLRVIDGRECLSVTQLPWSGDCVHRNISASFSSTIRLVPEVFSQRPLTSPNRNRINITSRKQIITVSPHSEWAIKSSITRSLNGEMHSANSMLQNIPNSLSTEVWPLSTPSSVRYGDFFTFNIVLTYSQYRYPSTFP